jgi:hypothetical protein
MGDNAVYGQYLLVCIGQNLKYGAVVATVLVHVAASKIKEVVVRDRILEELLK